MEITSLSGKGVSNKFNGKSISQSMVESYRIYEGVSICGGTEIDGDWLKIFCSVEKLKSTCMCVVFDRKSLLVRPS